MTGSLRPRRALLIAPAAVLGVLTLVWAAVVGPVSVMSPSGRRLTFDPAPSEEASGYTPPPTLEETTRDVEQTLDLSWLGTLIAWAVVLLMALALVVAARWAWQRRWRPAEAPPEVDFEVVSRRVAEAVAEDLAAQLEAVGQGSPRNGIVRCWLRLENAVAGAGLQLRTSETSAEFTVRVLHALDVDPRALGRLAGLYREARFSEHEMPEAARANARAALEQLHEDLRVAGGPR